MRGSNAFVSTLWKPFAARTRQHQEHTLARARILIAAVCSLALYLGPRTSAPHDLIIRVLAAGYFVASIGISGLARARAYPSLAFEVSVHIFDLVWPSLICLFAGDRNIPAVIILFFAVLAAACRWGLVETLGTATALVLLAWLGRAVAVWSGNGPGHLFLAQRFTTETFATAAFGLLLTAALLGYLTDGERALYTKILALSRAFTVPGSEVSFREALEPCLHLVGTLVDARRVVLAVQEDRSGQAFLWDLDGREPDGNGTLHSTELNTQEREQYFFDAPAESWHTTGEARAEHGDLFRCLVVNARGQQLPEQYFSFSQAFFAEQPFRSLFAINLGIANGWSGRLFLLDCENENNPVVELGFLQALALELLPSLYNAYLFHRVRSRAKATERLRIAHDLHDGLVQSLISIEMELEVLLRQTIPGSPPLAQEIQRVQRRLQQEIVEARSFMDLLKLDEMSPRQLVNAMADMVTRFQRETGIIANFAADSEHLELQAHTCREIACILQEALTNVRKHSGAKSVRVHFGFERSGWRLTVADNGRGFSFSGRLSHADLDHAGTGPVVIKERARSIGAGLNIESAPGQGSCVEIFQR